MRRVEFAVWRYSVNVQATAADTLVLEELKTKLSDRIPSVASVLYFGIFSLGKSFPVLGHCTVVAATTVRVLCPSVLEAVSTKVWDQSAQKLSLTPVREIVTWLSVSDTSGNTDKNFSHRKHY